MTTFTISRDDLKRMLTIADKLNGSIIDSDDIDFVILHRQDPWPLAHFCYCALIVWKLIPTQLSVELIRQKLEAAYSLLNDRYMVTLLALSHELDWQEGIFEQLKAQSNKKM